MLKIKWLNLELLSSDFYIGNLFWKQCERGNMERRTGASDESVSQIEETIKYFKEMLEGVNTKSRIFQANYLWNHFLKCKIMTI